MKLHFVALILFETIKPKKPAGDLIPPGLLYLRRVALQENHSLSLLTAGLAAGADVVGAAAAAVGAGA